jgi:hypothetical protein
LKMKQSFEIIENLKNIFAIHGIPEKFIADNMPFNSNEFWRFSKEWNFQIHTSSPRYAQSNGLAEKAVGICKKMLSKTQDFRVALMEYRNTPISFLGASPNEILFSRRTRTKLPIHSNLLKPKLTESVKELIRARSKKVSDYYNRSAKRQVVDYKGGDNIVFQKNNKWESGKVVQPHHAPRSFIIRDSTNRLKRRNAFHLRPSFVEPRFSNRNDTEILDQNNESICRNLNMNDESISRNLNMNDNLQNSENFDNYSNITGENTNKNEYITKYGRVCKPTQFFKS